MIGGTNHSEPRLTRISAVLLSAVLCIMTIGCKGPLKLNDVPEHLTREAQVDVMVRSGNNPDMRTDPYEGGDAAIVTLELDYPNPTADPELIVLYATETVPHYLASLWGARTRVDPWRVRWWSEPQTNRVKGSTSETRQLLVMRRMRDRLFSGSTLETCVRSVTLTLEPGGNYVVKVANMGGGCEFTVVDRSTDSCTSTTIQREGQCGATISNSAIIEENRRKLEAQCKAQPERC